MAIRHWSGRRLVGTWVAGVAGEAVLLALPVAFMVVTALASAGTETFVGSRPSRAWSPAKESRVERIVAVQERAARSAAVAARAAEAEARVAEAEARVAQAEARIAAVRANEAVEARAELRAIPLPPAQPQLAIENDLAIGAKFARAEALDARPWYGVPLVGALALYVLAIPLGLLAITFVWMIARFTGFRPPPSAA